MLNLLNFITLNVAMVAQKDFRPYVYTKTAIENEPVRVFQYSFELWEV